MEFKKVLWRKDGIKYVIIPKDSDINAGDQVIISNNLNLITKFLEEKNARKRKEEKS